MTEVEIKRSNYVSESSNRFIEVGQYFDGEISSHRGPFVKIFGDIIVQLHSPRNTWIGPVLIKKYTPIKKLTIATKREIRNKYTDEVILDSDIEIGQYFDGEIEFEQGPFVKVWDNIIVHLRNPEKTWAKDVKIINYIPLKKVTINICRKYDIEMDVKLDL